MSEEKKDHQDGDVEVSILRDADAEDAPTPPPLPELWGSDGRARLDVTIGFSTTDKWISKLIRWITRSKVSHAWIAFFDETLGMRLVMQAEWFGYELRPWARWKRENILVAEFIPRGNSLKESLKWIATFLGARYDYRAALLAGLWRWLGRAMRGKFNDPDKLMCSEGVIRFLQNAGYEAVADMDPEITSPKRLLVRCFQRTSEFVPLFALPNVQERYGRRGTT